MKLQKWIQFIKESGDRRAELVRFVMVGGVATLLQYLFYLVIGQWLGQSAVLATIVSYCLSLVANFILSNFFTFRSRPNTKKAASFIASHLINMGLQAGLVAIFQPLVGKAYALLPAMVICVPVNYCMVRFSLTSRKLE